MAKTYLLSRTLDPILGIFTGLLAFHLNETNPRSAPLPGHTLRELIAWKWNDSKQLRQAREKEDDGEWERVTRELGVGAGASQGEKK
ncbi:uncharacterized protein I303_106420 [Kwoniella dejecticola CBS 10117]|uniref:Uncharacterized protein n=1 Tax=Kwoniella dejecticola CBS 10117 TaxID=1296121 RepID=A0A1A5ZUR4_9TREE|nr:uncharacterized protein I303_08321 [Kwoniella dejecticola CBS 10117]OBR81551.1 hypothetical protein I303_08321 [Kwoniella dejecticola CBS 10117]